MNKKKAEKEIEESQNSWDRSIESKDSVAIAAACQRWISLIKKLKKYGHDDLIQKWRM